MNRVEINESSQGQFKKLAVRYGALAGLIARMNIGTKKDAKALSSVSWLRPTSATWIGLS